MKTIKLSNGLFEYDPGQPLGNPGGFGQVFIGKTPEGHEVAVKKLYVSAADAAHRELRIADELKGISYEHVIPFIDAGEEADSGEYFVIMPKADESLQATVERNRKLSTLEAAAVLLQIVKGLMEVRDIVHRDLKPDNILLHQGKWKIADFGIARFIEEATASKTLKDCLSPYYAAPEQWRMERATHATDVYALGCIGFFLLVGLPPFTINPSEEHQLGAVPPFTCHDSRLSTLINMMLRKIPTTRPAFSRIRNLLTEIVEKPQQPSDNLDPMNSLANAAAHVANEEQRLQAALQLRTAEANSRKHLARSSFEILSENLERFWRKILSQAPNAKLKLGQGTGGFKCGVGDGSLIVDLSNSDYMEAGLFSRSDWDVVSSATIRVEQSHPHYVWSASLWYAKLPETTEYRWYEVSYWDWNGSKFQPFASSNILDADYAASKASHTVSIAFGPIPIDDEKEEDFHKRWVWVLAKAAESQLKLPRSMPIDRWPPQFT